MNLQELIIRRKSVRSYKSIPVDADTLDRIREFAAGIRPLYPEIQVHYEILGREQVKSIFPWTPPQLMAIFSEDREGAAENIGFMFQQMDLFLQSIGLGACWLGLGRLSARAAAQFRSGRERFVIMLAFGHPGGDALRSGPEAFRRKSLAEIADRPDERLEPARLAPSSVNSQPWYFVHDGDMFHAHCRRSLLGALGEMNRIDMGICLAHMYIANPETFHFFRTDTTENVKGCSYIGSFTL